MNPNQLSIYNVLKGEYKRFFEKDWSLMVGGVLIGILSIVAFVWAKPLGVAGGIRNWGDWFFYFIGLYDVRPAFPLTSSKSVMLIGIIWGALIAALMARQFHFRIPPMLEIAKGVTGGIFLGVGAALSGGCNVGGFYSSIGAYSLSGFAMMVGLILGAYTGLRYLYWELEHLPAAVTANSHHNTDISGEDNGPKHFQPVLGGCLILSAICANEIYSTYGYMVSGGLLLCGIAFGFVMHRSRFCFARCFREPFMTGDADATRAVIASLLICAVGFAVIKWVGLRNELAFTSSSFGLGGAVGGFIFGFGMLLTGGCGSGAIWRAAEGQTKLMVALFAFALSTSLAKSFIRSSAEIQPFIGWKVFLPDFIGYPLAIFCVFVVLSIWYIMVIWNEKTEYFVVEM